MVQFLTMKTLAVVAVTLVLVDAIEHGSPCVEWRSQRGNWTSAGALAVDKMGDISIVGGSFSPTLDGFKNKGGSDVMVMKRYASGEWAWTFQTGSAGWDAANAIAVNDAGDLFITGDTTESLSGSVSIGGDDIFVMSLTADGQWRWTLQTGTASDDYAKAITLNKGGDVFVAGYTNGAFPSYVNEGNKGDIVVMKVLADGTLAWTLQRGSGNGTSTSSGSDHDSATAIATDKAGNIYIAGVTHGDLMGGGGNLQGHSNPFVSKILADGTWDWTFQAYDLYDATGITLDEADGVFVTGNGKLDKMYVMKLDAISGSQAWTTSWSRKDSTVSKGIVLDSQGDAYITGNTVDELTFKESSWVMQVLANGSIGWSLAISERVSYNRSNAIAMDESENIFIGGGPITGPFGVPNEVIENWVYKVQTKCDGNFTTTASPAPEASSAPKATSAGHQLFAVVGARVAITAIMLKLLQSH